MIAIPSCFNTTIFASPDDIAHIFAIPSCFTTTIFASPDGICSYVLQPHRQSHRALLQYYYLQAQIVLFIGVGAQCYLKVGFWAMSGAPGTVTNHRFPRKDLGISRQRSILDRV